jgi:hypothetical protein
LPDTHPTINSGITPRPLGHKGHRLCSRTVLLRRNRVLLPPAFKNPFCSELPRLLHLHSLVVVTLKLCTKYFEVIVVHSRSIAFRVLYITECLCSVWPDSVQNRGVQRNTVLCPTYGARVPQVRVRMCFEGFISDKATKAHDAHTQNQLPAAIHARAE